jgi:hypothetical protein
MKTSSWVLINKIFMAELNHANGYDMLAQNSEQWFEVKYAIPVNEILTNKAR